MAVDPLRDALARTRGHLLDPEGLVRAVASGRRKGQRPPHVQGRDVRRVELRYVDLKAGRHLQVTSFDETQAHTANFAVGGEAEAAVDALLDEPFGNWHVDTTTQTHQVRGTKKLEAVVHTKDRAEPVAAERGHDRDKQRLLAEDDPVLVALGISDAQGRIKPTGRRSIARWRSSCGCSTRRSPTRSPRDSCAGRPRPRPVADRRPRLRQRLPDVRRPALPRRVRGAAGARHRGRRQAAVGRPQRRRRRRASASTPTSSSAPSATRRCRSRPTWCSPCTPATPPPTTRWPGRSSGSRRPGAGRPVLPPRHRGPAAQGAHARAVRPAHPARDPARALRRHPHRRAARLDPAAGRLSRRRRRVRRERAHAPATRCCARPAPARARSTGGGVREEYDDLVATWGVTPKLAELVGIRVADLRRGAPARLGVVAVVTPFVIGLTAAGADRDGRGGLPLPDPEIVESSGLVLDGDRAYTINDSGDTGRVFTVDVATGETVGVTYWADGPDDVEALAPAGPGQVWVADIGDNSASRDSIQVTRVPVGDGDRTVDEETSTSSIPTAQRDAEALLVHPVTGRLYVATRASSAASCTPRRPSWPAMPPTCWGWSARRRDRHRRRVLPRRGAPGAADLHRRRRLHLPGAGAGRRLRPARARSRARGSPPRRRGSSTSAARASGAGAAGAAAAGDQGGAGSPTPTTAPSGRPANSPGPEPEGGATAVEDIAAEAVDRDVWPWVVSALVPSASASCCCARSGRADHVAITLTEKDSQPKRSAGTLWTRTRRSEGTVMSAPADARADTASRGRTPPVIRLLVAATFVVILNETIMINAIPG